MSEDKTTVGLTETIVLRKYIEEDYDNGNGPYEEITLIYEDGLLVSEEVTRKEDDDGIS